MSRQRYYPRYTPKMPLYNYGPSTHSDSISVPGNKVRLNTYLGAKDGSTKTHLESELISCDIHFTRIYENLRKLLQRYYSQEVIQERKVTYTRESKVSDIFAMVELLTHGEKKNVPSSTLEHKCVIPNEKPQHRLDNEDSETKHLKQQILLLDEKICEEKERVRIIQNQLQQSQQDNRKLEENVRKLSELNTELQQTSTPRPIGKYGSDTKKSSLANNEEMYIPKVNITDAESKDLKSKLEWTEKQLKLKTASMQKEIDNERKTRQQCEARCQDAHDQIRRLKACEKTKIDLELDKITKKYDDEIQVIKDELIKLQEENNKFKSDHSKAFKAYSDQGRIIETTKEVYEKQIDELKEKLHEENKRKDELAKASQRDWENEGKLLTASKQIQEFQEKLDKECRIKTELQAKLLQLKDQIHAKEEQTATQIIQIQEAKCKLENEVEEERLKTQDMIIKLKANEEEKVMFNKRIKELTDNECRIADMQETAYERGRNEGHKQGVARSSDQIQDMETQISKMIKEKSTFEATLGNVREELCQTTDRLREKITETEIYSKRLQEAKSEMEQIRLNKQTYSQDMIEELQHEMALKESQYEHDISVFEEQLRDIREERDMAQIRCREIAEENTKNVNRLAAEMNAKVSSDESALENISIQARPMKIAEDYTLLLSNAWLDAKSALDDLTPDDSYEAEKVQLLFDILMISEEEAKTVYKQIVHELGKTLRDPIINIITRSEKVAAAGNDESKEEKGLPQNLLTVIGDYLRNLANTVNLEYLVQRVRSAIRAKFRGNTDVISTGLQTEDVSEFINESVRIAWKMAIQRPPMTFDASQVGQPWHKDSLLELMWGSDPKAQNAVIQYYKGPKLLHAGKTMMKGSVFVHSIKNP